MLVSWIQPNCVQVKVSTSIHLMLSASNPISDKTTIAGCHYQGFPLRNYGTKNSYSRVTLDECQYLCEISDLCQYFNYAPEVQLGKPLKTFYDLCYLKFGVGKKVNITNGAFGYKYSPGEK